MEKEYLGYLTRFEQIGEGANADLFIADYKDEICVYKEFRNSQYLKLIQDKIKKLVSKNITDSGLILPYKLLYDKKDDEDFISYLTEYKYKYEPLHEYDCVSYEKKIKRLKKIRTILDRMHNEYKIVHCDLYHDNLLYNDFKEDACIIDFDTYIDLETKEGYMKNNVDPIIENYIDRDGLDKIDKDIDIYMFNLLCYSFFTNIRINDALANIKAKRFDIINNTNAINILDSYNKGKTLKKEYIIDYL